MYMLTRYPESRLDRRDEVTLRDIVMPRSAESHPVTLAEVCLRALRDVEFRPVEDTTGPTQQDRYYLRGSLHGIRGCRL